MDVDGFLKKKQHIFKKLILTWRASYPKMVCLKTIKRLNCRLLILGVNYV